MESQKRANIFVKFIKSFTDFNIYCQIRREKTSKAIGYLLLLCLVLGIIYAGFWVNITGTSIDQTIQFLESNESPDIYIENGRLTVDIDKPIIHVQDNDLIFILDMSNEHDLNDLAGYSTGYLITPERVIIFQAGSPPIPLEFSSLEDMHIDKLKITSFLQSMKGILFASLFVVIIIGTILLKFLESLFASIIGLMVNAIMNTPFTFNELYKIGIYAMTLPSLIILLINSFLIPLSFGIKLLLYYGLVTVIIHIALKHMAKDNDEPSKDPQDVINY